MEKVLSVCRPEQWVILSGGLPPGIPPALFGEFVRQLKEKKAKVAVDSSGLFCIIF